MNTQEQKHPKKLLDRAVGFHTCGWKKGYGAPPASFFLDIS
jgi:hypothetical protein